VSEALAAYVSRALSACWVGEVSQRGSTEEMPENVHFCIEKAATHSHFIQSTPF